MRIVSNGTELAVTVSGDGPPVVLLHGWPHTRRLWADVPLPGRRVIAPDSRGVGDSAPATDGFDAATLADDVLGVLDALDAPAATVAAIDAGVPVGFLLAARHPGRVRRLVLMEGTLPGVAGGFDVPPWWFGFHGVPGLAEAAVAGNEDAYLGWFLRDVADPEVRRAFVDGYRGRLAAGFGTYRAMARNAELIRAAGRLRMPVVALAGNVVGERLHRQLIPIADDLTGEILDRCGHLVPLDRPDALTRVLAP